MTPTAKPLRMGPPLSEALRLVRLDSLMEATTGRPAVTVAVVDGPAALRLPAFAETSVRLLHGRPGACSAVGSAACDHGTLVSAILFSSRESGAPAICPDCTALLRPVFSEDSGSTEPASTPRMLAEAIVDCIEGGARIINLSLAVLSGAHAELRLLTQALDRALVSDVLVVAAAGNQGTLVSSPITRHPAVLPVASCDLRGRPSPETNLGRSIGARGLLAPSVGFESHVGL
jgi:subtilisin family serine protease